MQMIPRNVPYGSGCWITETGFLVGLTYQREVRPDNQEHMPEVGLSDWPSLSLHRSDRCVQSHEEEMCVHAQIHISTISKFKWNTGPLKEMEKCNLNHLIKYLITMIVCGVSIMSLAAEELQLILVGKCSETWGDPTALNTS